MRVFVAGATGVAGRRAVARLVAAGHQVTGTARAPGKVAQIEALGAAAVNVDLYDVAALRDAISGHDAVVNLATKIPPLAKMATMSAWSKNERIRREASGHVVDAAIATGVTVFVQESLAFLYGEHGDEWIDAASTAWSDSPFTEAVKIAEANVARFTASGGRGVVLRFGRFYAPDSDQVRALVQAARRGVAGDFGPADSYLPQIDADDVATAVVAALDAPSGVYDVVDDEPMTRGQQDRALAAAVGRRRLWRGPAWLRPKIAGYLVASQRVSNRRFRDATGWKPSSPSMREGYRKLVTGLGIKPPIPGFSRLILWLLAFSAFTVGVQAAFFPQSFYDDFPFGRGWVAMDGPYNEHLVRDFGAMNLALLVVTASALVMASMAWARVAAIAWLVYGIPHFVYHQRHLTMDMAGSEKVALMLSLALPLIGALIVLFSGHRSTDDVEAGAFISLDDGRAPHMSPASRV
jgi:nucleoside-diphosphate-sugar epimerase